jgi:hypothetical protein
LADNELLKLFAPLRILRYEDTEGIADFGLQKSKLIRLCAEKTVTSAGATNH